MWIVGKAEAETQGMSRRGKAGEEGRWDFRGREVPEEGKG